MDLPRLNRNGTDRARILTGPGTAFLLSGLAGLAGAAVLGRRDLLALSVFLLALPLLAILGVRRRTERFRVRRDFSPATEGATTTVRLRIESLGPGRGFLRRGEPLESRMTELLPPVLGGSPQFQYPSRTARGGPVSQYEYRLVPPHRGLFRAGGVLAEFRDPFNLARRRHRVDPGSVLTVAPSLTEASAGLVDLVRGQSGAGVGGSQATSWVVSASENDVMVREYRYGDALRRVHWPSTARRGELMVRHEEGGSLPRISLILDRRSSAHTGGELAGFPVPQAAAMLRTSATFEWQVRTFLSLAVGLSSHGHELRLHLDGSAERTLSAAPGSPDTARLPAGPLGASDAREVLPGLLAAVELEEDGERLDLRGTGSLVVVFTGRIGQEDARDLAAGVLGRPGVESSWSGSRNGMTQATVISCWPAPPPEPVRELLETAGWRVLWSRPDSVPGRTDNDHGTRS